MTGKEDPHEALCMHCGGEVNWRFVDDREDLVEVVCPDCGRFQVRTVDFEQEEFEIVPAAERE